MFQPRVYAGGVGLAVLLVATSAWTEPAASIPGDFEAAGGLVTVSSPVVDDWAGFRTLRGQLPVASQAGAWRLAFEADTAVDFTERRVRLYPIRFGQSPESPLDALAAAFRRDGLSIGLDHLIASLPADFALPEGAGAVPQLNFNPPRIIVSERPRRLMLIDGPPAMVPIDGTALEFVVNTDWDVFHDTRGGGWYVLDNGQWISSNMLSSGDWKVAMTLPDDFRTLQLNSDWPQVAAALPPRVGQKPLPITISYEPTELILIDGPAEIEEIGGGLRHVANTPSDLFLYADRYYYLAAGRWFHTKRLDRQWFAVRDLPAAFAEIPQDHARAHVLAAVSGTPEARAAAIEAAIPRVTTLAVDAADSVTVPYLGPPSFVDIEGTRLRRAENTPFQVIQHNNFYYLCHAGAWYASSDPVGPWSAAREVPQAIYSIPPTDPAYNVTFVRLDAFDADNGRAAYVSTSGYYNRYYTGSTMVYGTGWYYPGYHHGSAYWRYPGTYGYFGPWGGYGPYVPPVSETFEIDRRAVDWEWDLDGSKRRVYDYGPDNRIGAPYVPPTGATYPEDSGG
jgi:hypothetical protein